jgi:hypothetical protein
MTAPQTPSLLNPADLNSFQASSPDFFLSVAGDTIRNFCQWHIYPSLTVTELVPIQPEGTIMLPSLYVTGVESITLNGLTLNPSAYHWHKAGFINRIQHHYFQWPLWPLESEQRFREYPSPLARHAEVTYTHGYETLPPIVAGVGMELANRAMELPSGIATQISSGPYSISMGALGLVLTDDQRRRLGPFTLVRF